MRPFIGVEFIVSAVHNFLVALRYALDIPCIRREDAAIRSAT
jgi:hypothetical protein